MSFSIGIVGLPNVGKSTLFKALTKKQVDASNYPFCTIDPNVGVVAVPDERIDKLSVMSKSAKTIYTTIEFVDIAGLVKDAHKGEGLGNKFLANIREVDAIVQVVRQFIGQRNRVKGVAGRAESGADRGRCFFKSAQRIMLMVEHLAGKSVINAIVQIIAGFAVADGFADNFYDQGAGRGHHKPPRLGNHLDIILFKQPFDFRVYFFSQDGE